MSTGTLFWSYRTIEPITSSVAVGSGTVYIGADSNKLYAF
ncbi:MAG: PQQ-binding-like beta-propeller repeat protein [bacterium]